MPSPRLALPVLSAILACGPTPGTTTHAATDTTAAASTTDAGTAAPTSSTSATASATADPTTTTATTDALTTAPQTTGEPGSSTGGATTDGTTTTTTDGTTGGPGSSTGGPAPVQYAAQYYAGGLDRIFVRKADADADLCTEVVFVWPGQPSANLTLPAMWGLQWAIVVDGAAGCLDLQNPLQNGVMATGVTGEATWDAMFCPKTLDVDVVATFPQGQPWVPAQVALQAAALPLQGC